MDQAKQKRTLITVACWGIIILGIYWGASLPAPTSDALCPRLFACLDPVPPRLPEIDANRLLPFRMEEPS